MLAFEKFLASFLSLPGLFIVLWAVLTIYVLARGKSLFIKFLALFSLGLMCLIFTGLGSYLFLFPLEGRYPPLNTPEADYPIVVLGGGINYLQEGKAELNAISLQRVVKGLELYQQIGGPLIFSGGVGIGQQGISEAEVAASWWQRMGVKREEMVLETQARTSYENGLYVSKWLREQGYQQIYLVTSAVHLPRSVLVFRQQNIDVIPVPAGYLANHHLSWLDYLPNRQAAGANLAAIHEWLGIIWYRIRGRI